MDRHQTRFLLVTGEDGKLLGVVTARDLLRVFLRPDAAIKAEISRDVLSRYPGTNPALVQVDVTDGVVRMTGELERKSMLAAALREGKGALSRSRSRTPRFCTPGGPVSGPFPGPHRRKDGGLELDPDTGGPGIRDPRSEIRD